MKLTSLFLEKKIHGRVLVKQLVAPTNEHINIDSYHDYYTNGKEDKFLTHKIDTEDETYIHYDASNGEIKIHQNENLIGIYQEDETSVDGIRKMFPNHSFVISD